MTDEQTQVFDALVLAFEEGRALPVAERWRPLEAAHVLGQSRLSLHWRSHVLMLRFALELRDWPEALGQALRLALVPPGHLLGRLPAGNIGRATVHALRPMAPQPELEALLGEARRSVRDRQRGVSA
ncbi:MAG: DUF3703 domain-containing protein [Myxococcaceae bacterium]|nr:MAG: DUF3703 domain-containing protein [Myxococcaceae bacterium]